MSLGPCTRTCQSPLPLQSPSSPAAPWLCHTAPCATEPPYRTNEVSLVTAHPLQPHRWFCHCCCCHRCCLCWCCWWCLGVACSCHLLWPKSPAVVLSPLYHPRRWPLPAGPHAQQHAALQAVPPHCRPVDRWGQQEQSVQNITGQAGVCDCVVVLVVVVTGNARWWVADQACVQVCMHHTTTVKFAGKNMQQCCHHLPAPWCFAQHARELMLSCKVAGPACHIAAAGRTLSSSSSSVTQQKPFQHLSFGLVRRPSEV